MVNKPTLLLAGSNPVADSTNNDIRPSLEVLGVFPEEKVSEKLGFNWGFGVTQVIIRLVLYPNLVEETGLEPVQCGFESHQDHST